jgi:hypothetical protein
VPLSGVMNDRVRIIIGVVCVSTFYVCAVRSLVVHTKMLDEVNSRLPKEQQFAYGWWWLGKTLRFHAEYHRLFPTGAGIRTICALGTGSVAAGVLLMAVIGFGATDLLCLAVGGGVVMWIPYWATYRR